MDEEAKKYAYEVLEKADKKIRAIGQTGLKIPAIYRPYSAIDKAPVLNNDKIAAKKVDFSKLEPSALNGSFSSAAKSKKRLSLSYSRFI